MDERIESGREFQTVGAAARKEQELKVRVRLVRGTLLVNKNSIDVEYRPLSEKSTALQAKITDSFR